MKRILIFAVMLLFSVAVALPATAGSIDSYINGPWLKFFFEGPGSDAYGCSYCGGQSEGSNGVFLDPAPWSLNLAAPAVLTITDIFQRGDNFNLYDFNSLILATPPVASGSNCGPDPESCYGADGVSCGTLGLSAGLHTLTIRLENSPYNQGAAYFRVDQVSTPEPGTLLLVSLGLIGLGISTRRRS